MAVPDNQPIRDSVTQFAELMERVLRENDFKGGWERITPAQLINRLVDELDELVDAIHAGRTNDVIKEAVDVANFAMMLADNASKTGAAKSLIAEHQRIQP